MPDADAGNSRANCTKEIFPSSFDEAFETGDVDYGGAATDFRF